MAAEQRTGYLGLGSNVGDPAAHLRAAIELLARAGSRSRPSPRPTRPSRSARSSTSPTSSTPPIRIRTELEPEQLLDACKAVEAARGRTFDAPRHSPRPLDVDLLLLGDLELETERLTLPHREVDQPPLRPRPAAGARPGADPAGRDAASPTRSRRWAGQRAERVGSPDGGSAASGSQAACIAGGSSGTEAPAASAPPGGSRSPGGGRPASSPGRCWGRSGSRRRSAARRRGRRSAIQLVDPVEQRGQRRERSARRSRRWLR